jgi:hypothetical protein
MLRELRLTDLQIKSCSLWVAPDGTEHLPVPHTIPFYFNAPANPPQTTAVPDVELGTPPKYKFLCKVVSAAFSQPELTPITTPTIQIQWPDGRYLSNPGIDVYSFIGTGKNGRLISPHKLMEPNSKIRMNVDNTAAAVAYQVVMFFEGCLLVPLIELKGAGRNGR